MEVHKLFTDDRAVSPVVGVALLIAVAVILAAVIGAVVLGLGSGGADTPQAQLSAEIVNTDNVKVTHNGGSPLPANEIVFNLNDGASTDTMANDLTAGNSVEIFTGTAVTSGDEIAVVWQDPNSDQETVIETLRV